MNASVAVVPLGEAVKPTRLRVKPSDYPELPFIGMEHIEAHSMKLLGTVPAKTMKSSAVHFKPGDVLYGRLRPYLNKVYRPSFEGLCSAEFIVLPENDRVDGTYLQYFLNSGAFVRYATHLNAGDRPRVDFDQIAPYEIPLPRKKEQHRIVATIDKQFSRLDQAGENFKRIVGKLKRYRASVLHFFYLGGTMGEELPPDWKWTTIGEQFRVEVGATPSRKQSTYWGGGIPWVSSGEVQFNRIKRTTETITDEGLANSSTKLNPAGSVLLGMIGQGRTRGQAAILDIEAANNQNCAAIWVSKTETPSEFVYYWLMSHYEATRRVGSGNNQQAMNKALVQRLPIPWPRLIAEQQRVVERIEERLSVVEDIETQVRTSLAHIRLLRSSLLRRVFAVCNDQT